MITLITGGIKSGKSSFALKLAEKSVNKNNFYFIATAVADGEELEERIKKHRRSRKSFWNTIEEPEKLNSVVEDLPEKSTVLIDCITLWAGSIVSKPGCSLPELKRAKSAIKSLMKTSAEKKLDLFIVTNEVGSGIIPENRISRIYEDFLGVLNTIIAASADEVYFLVSGVDIKIKGKK